MQTCSETWRVTLTMAVLKSLVDRPFNALYIVVAFLGGLQAFQWTVTSPGDNITTRLNPGEDLQLLWNFTLADGEMVSTVQWFFLAPAAEALVAMATPRGGFIAIAPYTGRVDYRPLAGLVLRGWSSGDVTVAENGSYAVEVAILAAGSSYATYRRTMNVQLTDQSSVRPDLSRLLRLEDRVQWLEASVAGLSSNLSSHLAARVETPDFAMSSAPCAAGTHSIINQTWRHEHAVQGTNCDNHLVPGWHRFLFNGAEAFITTRCPGKYKCGTLHGMWLDMEGQAMPNVGQEVTARAYATDYVECYYKQNKTVTMKNCGPYYVYNIVPSVYCPSAYCTTMALK